MRVGVHTKAGRLDIVDKLCRLPIRLSSCGPSDLLATKKGVKAPDELRASGAVKSYQRQPIRTTPTMSRKNMYTFSEGGSSQNPWMQEIIDKGCTILIT